ncbi:MAG TPA: saccharopine dehydrogenase NADP-binding domain-containing protein [Parvibaculum sp.]
MSDKFMIYGATGYTGKLVTRTAKALGMRPLIAGRNEARLKSVAGQHGFDYRAFDLSDTAALNEALSHVDAVLHIAGPFSQTSKPMLDACLRMRKHYLDITGEIDVFEACAGRDDEAKKAGIMVMPGVGFDVVPTDCLAAHMKRRMPDATEITLAVSVPGSMSRGSAKTGVESVGFGTRVRRDGRIVSLKVPPRRQFDFGRGPQETIGFSWGDVAMAFHSTGVPNITVYFEASPQFEQLAAIGSFKRWLASRSFMQRRLKKAIDQQPEGPSDAERRSGVGILIGEAVNADGDRAQSRLTIPEPYTLTVMTSLEIVRRVLNGEAQPGFQTPSRVFGADFITEFDGCLRQDLNS